MSMCDHSKFPTLCVNKLSKYVNATVLNISITLYHGTTCKFGANFYTTGVCYILMKYVQCDVMCHNKRT